MKRRILISIAMAILAVSSVSIGAMATFAGFEKAEAVNRTITAGTSRYVYLKPGGSTLWDKDGATYFMYCWQSGDVYEITEPIWNNGAAVGNAGRILGFLRPKYTTGFKFIRAKNGMTLATMRNDRGKATRHTSDNDGYAWDWTADITPTTYNQYTITAFGGGDHVSSCSPGSYS